MSRCEKCGHDLICLNSHEGSVYCSNGRCKHSKKPHPTKGDLNKGRNP